MYITIESGRQVKNFLQIENGKSA